MDTRSPWPLALKYALILALAFISIDLIFFLISPDVEPKSWSFSGILKFLLNLSMGGYIMFIAAKARRDQDFDGIMSYGKALGFMMFVALPASFVISFYAYIYSTYINPELIAKMMNAQAEALSQQGKSDEEIEQMLKVMRIFSSPIPAILAGILASMLQLLLISLISSIFVKKEPKTIE